MLDKNETQLKECLIRKFTPCQTLYYQMSSQTKLCSTEDTSPIDLKNLKTYRCDDVSLMSLSDI